MGEITVGVNGKLFTTNVTPEEVTEAELMQEIPLPPTVNDKRIWSLWEGMKLKLLALPDWAIPFLNQVKFGAEPVPEVVEVTKTEAPVHTVVALEEIATDGVMELLTLIEIPDEVAELLVKQAGKVPPVDKIARTTSPWEGV